MNSRMAAVVVMLGGCVASPDAGGREIYMALCAACHGASGQGGGPGARSLPVRPPDLTTLAERNGGVFPASDVMAQIYGFPGPYHTRTMPSFGPELGGPEVMWTDETGETLATPQSLLDLVAYLERIQG